jgi:hypothetical protein
MKYLIYDHEKYEIVPADAKPSGYVSTKHPDLVGGLIPVWHASPVNPEMVVQAIHVLMIRIKEFPFDEINSAVNQLVAKYPPKECSIAALGASPKFIKWILKQKGYNTIAIGVSKVKLGVKPTGEFIDYLNRKLGKVTNNKIVLLDYVDSGESIVQIKRILTELWKKGPVVAAALGAGTKFKEDGEYAKEIDFIVKNIPELTKGFQGVKYKQILGRAKNMVDYSTYPKPVRGGQITTLEQKKFSAAKSAFARAAELGPLKIVLDESYIMEIAETQSRDSDTDGDFEALIDDSDVWT